MRYGEDHVDVEESELTLRELVRSVIADLAPEELPLLASLNGFAEAEVGRTLAPDARQKGRDPLAFGLDGVLALASPIIWSAVQQTANRLTDEATDGVIDRTREFLRSKLRRKKADAPLPKFGKAELDEVHRQILESAKKAGLSAERAELLADAVVGRLARRG